MNLFNKLCAIVVTAFTIVGFSHNANAALPVADRFTANTDQELGAFTGVLTGAMRQIFQPNIFNAAGDLAGQFVPLTDAWRNAVDACINTRDPFRNLAAIYHHAGTVPVPGAAAAEPPYDNGRVAVLAQLSTSLLFTILGNCQAYQQAHDFFANQGQCQVFLNLIAAAHRDVQVGAFWADAAANRIQTYAQMLSVQVAPQAVVGIPAAGAAGVVGAGVALPIDVIRRMVGAVEYVAWLRRIMPWVATEAILWGLAASGNPDALWLYESGARHAAFVGWVGTALTATGAVGSRLKHFVFGS